MKALTLVALVGGLTVGALGAPVELHYFWAPTCPDCLVMTAYLETLAAEFPELRVVRHEVAYGDDEFRLMVEFAAAYGVGRVVTPVVVVGDLASVGIGRAVELRIAEEVARCAVEGCPSPLARLTPSRPAPAPPNAGVGAVGLRPLSLVILVGLGLAAALVVVWVLSR